MKKGITLSVFLVILVLLSAWPSGTGAYSSADTLYRMYPQPPFTLETDPAQDPLLKIASRVSPLPSSFKPTVVKPRVPIKKNAEVLLRREAATALESLFAAAKADGMSLLAVSGYRSFQSQKYIYARSVERNGEAKASLMSAPAGASEHQLGLAVDVSSVALEGDLRSSFAKKKEGKWLAAHCAEYGFIIRYKQDWADITGFEGEPWHLRYVGPEHAAYIARLDVPLETYVAYLQQVYAARPK